MPETTIDLTAAERRYHDLDVATWSDHQLVEHVADRIRIPRQDPADSFVLHAPLELLARSALLPWVAPAARRGAQLQLLALLDEYESWAPAELPTTRHTPGADADRAATTLVDAIAAGDLDAADQAAAAVAHATTPGRLAETIGTAVLPSLAAAAHAPILLYHLPRVAPRGELTPELLRPLVRELARYPQLALDWVHDRPTTGGSEAALEAAIASVPQLGVPGSTFIFPLMHQVDDGGTGTARALLADATAGVSPADAQRVLLRAAARAMLASDPEHMAYGWSHCLTMPQAALGIAATSGTPQLAIDVAATFVVGFLAGQASEPLPRTVEVTAPNLDWSTVISRACVLHDAHLVKYTLACLDAAHADPDAADLFRTAAARLLTFWESALSVA